MSCLQGPVITLTSDFGYSDPYVGIMKGAILSSYKEAILVDISHDITPHDIEEAALLLEFTPDYFPRGSIHLVVVDPGVGGSRHGIIVKSGRGDLFVGPDNGVFTYHLERAGLETAWRLSGPPPGAKQVPCNTFHGRDIFAPVAACLASGKSPDLLGNDLSELKTLDRVEILDMGDHIVIPIIRKDRFGNLVTALNAAFLRKTLAESESFRFIVAGAGLEKTSLTYSDVEPGQLLILPDSNNRIEIAAREGNASIETGLNPGDTITLLLKGRQKKEIRHGQE